MKHCQLCDGPLVLLGSLGYVQHFRCRNCGMMFSQEPDHRLIVKDMKNTRIPSDFIHGHYRDNATNWRGITTDDVATLGAGPRAEDYWDTWDEVKSRARYTDDRGTWRLRQGKKGLYLKLV